MRKVYVSPEFNCGDSFSALSAWRVLSCTGADARARFGTLTAVDSTRSTTRCESSSASFVESNGRGGWANNGADRRARVAVQAALVELLIMIVPSPIARLWSRW